MQFTLNSTNYFDEAFPLKHIISTKQTTFAADRAS